MKKITHSPSSISKSATYPETKKKHRVGRTGRRRVKKKAKKNSIEKGDRYYKRESSYSKVELVDVTSTTNPTPTKSSWLSTQLKMDLESSPKLIPEELVIDPDSHIHAELDKLSEVAIPKKEDLKYSEQYLGYLEHLDNIKEELGGAPNYFGLRPSLKASKLIFGLSVETVKIWISKAIKHSWFPKPLWQTLSKHFNIDGGMTHYEYLALAFQSLDQMKLNLSEIQTRLLTRNNSSDYFNKITGLTFHSRLNNPKVLASSLEDYLSMFEHQLEKALKNNHLKEFLLEALPDSDVCFEARLRSMIEYTSKNPLDEESGQSLNLDLIADYTSASSVEHALNEELRVLLWQGKLENPDRDSIREKIMTESQIVGKIFTGGIYESEAFLEFLGGEQNEKEIEVTEEIVDQYLDYAENFLCIF